jgi:hypothetical protein
LSDYSFKTLGSVVIFFFQSLTYKQETINNLEMSEQGDNDDGESVATNTTNTTATFSLEDIKDLLSKPTQLVLTTSKSFRHKK